MFGIIVIGDSITFGRGESPNIGWAGRLKAYFELQGFHNNLFNLGIPGNTTKSLLKRFEVELSSRVKYVYPGDKFIIMIAIGINDSRALKSPNNIEVKKDVFEKNILKLIKIAKNYSDKIVIVGLTPVNEEITAPFEQNYYTNARIKEYDEVLKKCAKINKVHHIELHSLLFKSNYKKLLADGLHPNSHGYDKMFKIIKKFLIKNSLIR